MASLSGNLSANMALDNNKNTGQQKRTELEREISTLEEMLKQEEKMHQVLEQAHQSNKTTRSVIPNYFPPKMKELLQELIVVEGEIAQLEGQISHLRGNMRQEEDATTKESRSRQWQHGVFSNPGGAYSLSPNPYSATRGGQENVGYETKALHFISKAMKGDYNLKDFSVNDRSGRFARLLPDHHKKENHFPEVGISDKVPRRSVSMKPASPLRDSRYATPKRERRVELPLSDLTSNTQPNLTPIAEESNQKLQPNKLSESIMKCLIFIFVRLIRTSRTMELEKSGPMLRASASSLSSISFRADTGAMSKSSIMLHRESKQQDPYGIFDAEESIPRDIGPYKNLVIFTSSSLDPKCISNSSSITLLEKLRGLMNSLQKVDLRFLTPQQKLAFWINVYNACIMHGFLQYGVPSSPEKLLTLMNKATLNIGGNVINAQAIERFILRKPASAVNEEAYQKDGNDDKEEAVRELYGLESFDPNVTFSLCCGTRSSPAVKIYTAEGVTAELEKSKLEFLQASIIVTSTKRIAFPELLFLNMLDFAEDVEALVKWVCHQLPTSGTLRKSMVECFRGQGNGKLSGIVEQIPYSFEFQYLLPI